MQVHVVAAAIVRDGRVLAARRSRPAAVAGGWEFPGGKVEEDESEPVALARECDEELGVALRLGRRLGAAVDGPIRLVLYAATLATGEPRPLTDHDEVRWLAVDELDGVDWLAVDRALLPHVVGLLRQHARMQFRATLELHGKTATGITVPDKIVEQLGGGKRPPVAATINGYTFRTTIAPMGGRSLLGVNAENRAAAGIVAGDVVDVDIELDTAPREVATPDDLAAALADAPQAQAFYDELSYTHRKEWVRWIEEAKKPDTRSTRVAKTVEALRGGKRTH